MGAPATGGKASGDLASLAENRESEGEKYSEKERERE